MRTEIIGDDVLQWGHRFSSVEIAGSVTRCATAGCGDVFERSVSSRGRCSVLDAL